MCFKLIHRKTVLLASWLCMGISLPVHLCAGQEVSPRFGSLSMEDGLSFFSVTGILQGSKGFLWVGTIDGLNRYDGYTFKHYKNSPGDSQSLPNNYINPNALAEDEEGNIWIGSRGGLSRHVPRLGTFDTWIGRRSNTDSTSGLSHNVVLDVVASQSGDIWVATPGGVDVLDRTSGMISSFNYDSVSTASLYSNMVLSLAESAEGIIWVGTNVGLCSIDPVNGTVERVIPTSAPIWSLFVDSSGLVWMGTEEGKVQQFDPSSGESHIIDLFQENDMASSRGYVFSIVADGSENVWVATYDGGLFRLDAEGSTRYLAEEKIFSLPSNQISSIFEDRSGKIWIGTGNGLAYVDSNKAFGNINPMEDIPLLATSIISTRSGDFWIGSEMHGAFYLHKNDITQYKIGEKGPGLRANNVTALLEDHEGNVWIGTSGGGVSTWNPVSGFNDDLLEDKMIYSIHEDKGHRVWIGTLESGVNLFRGGNTEVVGYKHDPDDSESLEVNEVYAVFSDQDDQLWLGTIGAGLKRLSLNNMDAAKPDIKFTSFKQDPADPQSISSNNVGYITEVEPGKLWLGTIGGGVNLFDVATETFTHWGVEEGITADNVACVLPDEAGYYWLPTSSGLTRLQPETGEVKTYGRADGLSNTVFAMGGCAVGPDGKFYMANQEDVTVFNPADITHNTTPPMPFITEVLLFNEPLVMDTTAAYKKDLRLKYNENFLAFEFSGSDYSIPEKNKFAYQLVGVDREFVDDRGGQLANYPNLSPGTYEFRVKASNNDGLWSTSYASMNIVIEKPYWSTWWFLCLILLGIGLITGVYVYNWREQRQKVNRTRQQIADDLHDDMGGKISALTMFLSKLSSSSNLDEQDRGMAQYFTEVARRLVGDLRDKIWLVDPGYENLQAFVDHLQRSIRVFPVETEMVFFDNTGGVTTELPMELRRHLLALFHEAIHNAVKHASASSITTNVLLKGKTLVIEISDDGVGYNIEQVQQGQGSKSMPRRAQDAGIDLEINSLPNVGTTVTIRANIA